MKFLIIILSGALIAGCASNPDKINAAYVSPIKYSKYDCDQVATEMVYISDRTVQLHKLLKKKRKDDNMQMGVGLVLFWPALFFLEGGDGPETVEYAKLKGEYEALRNESVQKDCVITSKSPEEIIKEQAKKSKQKEEASRGEDT